MTTTLINVNDETLNKLKSDINTAISNTDTLFQSSKFAKQLDKRKLFIHSETVNTLEETCVQLGKLLAYREVLQHLGQLKTYERTNSARRR